MTKTDEDLTGSNSTAALVAAMPDVDDALSAAQSHLAAKSQTAMECEVESTSSERVVKAMQDKAAALAKRIGAGEEVDPAEVAGATLKVALAKEESAIREGALVEARRLAAAAAQEVLKVRRQVALRDAQRLLAPVGAAYHRGADASDAFISAIKEGIAGTEAQMSAAEMAEGLRLELMGAAPDTRPYQFPHELEIRRFMSCLPVEWLREAGNGGFPVGDVDFRELAERYIARAAA